MTNYLHPSLQDIIPSVVTTILRRYRTYVEKGDLTQEAWAFVLSRAEQFNELLSVDSELQQKWNEKKIAWQIRRNLERYARKEKASKSGYQINDEAYYDTVTIAPYFFFFFATAALSTRFGYGRPAAFARFLAAVFCAGVNFLLRFFGFSVSQNAFFFTT